VRAARLLLAAALAAALLRCAPEPPPVPPVPPRPAETAPPPPVASAALRPDESFRERPPAPEPARPFVVPAATRLRLRNGIPVVVAQQPSSFVAIRIGAAGGVADVGPERVEVVDEMVRDLMAGAGKRSLPELRDAFVSLSMPEPEASWDVDTVSISLLVPAAKLREGIALAADLALRPSFDPKDLDRRPELHAAPAEKRDDADVVESVLRRVLFGSHIYAGGAVPGARRRAVTRADVVSLHARLFDASRLSIVVAGGAEAKDVAAWLEDAFGAMPRRAGPRPATPAPRPPSGPRLVVVDRPGAAVATIAMGVVGPADGAADLEAARLALDALTDRVFGRITTRLRGELGYVQSITTDVTPWLAGGSMRWRMRARSDRVAPVLVEADRILRDFASTGAAADDLAGTKARRALAFASMFETSASTARELLRPQVYQEPDDTLAKLPGRIAAVSPEEVKAAAARWLDADQVRTVVVGDWAALQALLAALGWGPVELRTFEGEVVRPVQGKHGARER
jgi:zinc protease